MDIKNKVIIITGGANGIGPSIAENFIRKEAKVVLLLDKNEERGIEAATILNTRYKDKAVYIKCDVRADLDIVTEAVFRRYKRIDILVNSAGVAEDNNYELLIETNLTALVKWSLKLFDHMQQNGGGTIMNISSTLGYKAIPYCPVYHATKFAVLGFTKSLGHVDNFANSNVRVLALCPGFTKTTLAPSIISKELGEFMSKQAWQSVDDVGEAAINMFQVAESGTAWVIESGLPLRQIS